ncbi:GNAT family N-acetyltransferase [Brucella pituitosa]|uniref:GNAT family N-acetyltransferase n=1 Tax=Brucella pituitosa TaxID=571256 RepID=A0A643EXJ9_9HYPH|nr:GNAT family N-acetyltransferase [Brucella pituitosa]KAB0570634.1 GNAT family N-acetyltransferase [Brucella pituitosa]MCK4205308.1 GNAT family N-acetyltransferase [Brucella pituitosa]PJO48982.1 N-acetyltransferase [Brucella pituitosa]PRA84816.1 GNAT family N-acetyltransferase [Ochrobactrum sp. MYb29]
MVVRVSVETPLQDDVRDLVEALNAHMLPLSPLEFQFKMTVEQMAEVNTTVFVARDENGKAVGCGALKMHDNGVGELKRMFTRPEVRGKRVGSLLVDAIVELARARGISRLVLETGTGTGFDGAWRLYENSGFVRCGVVLDYPDSEYSAFFEKRLVEA